MILKEILIGAAVVVKGTTIGTVTDFEGNFSLDVPRDAKMIFVCAVATPMPINKHNNKKVNLLINTLFI